MCQPKRCDYRALYKHCFRIKCHAGGEVVVFARQYKMDRAAHSSAMPSATADERIPAHSSKPSAMAA